MSGKKPDLTHEECLQHLNKELFPGLTRYFMEAGKHQEKLIELTSQTAQEVMIKEALFMALDFKNGEFPEDLRSHLQKILDSLLGDEAAHVSGFPDSLSNLERAVMHYNNRAILSRVASVGAKEDYHKDVENRRQKAFQKLEQDLRAEIDEFYQKTFTPRLTRDSGLTQAIVQFNAARDAQAERLTEYQVDMQSLLRATNLALETLPKDNADQATLKEVRALLEQRIDETEALRNGYKDEIDDQDPLLTHLKLETPEAKAIFNEQRPLKERMLDSLPGEYRKMYRSRHPLLEDVDKLNNRVRDIAMTSKHTYQQNAPRIEIYESGIKSWKRTIDKLIFEKEADWKKMTDLTRINPAFSRPEMLFHFNRAFRKNAATQLGWHINPPWEEKNEEEPEKYSYRDKGITVTPTGSLLWLMHFQAKAGDGNSWGIEVKLDDAHQREIETFTHQIFECARLIETDHREVDYPNLPQRFPRFIRETRHLLGLMQKFGPGAGKNHPLADPRIEERIGNILEEARNSETLEGELREAAAISLHDKLEELHIAICSHTAVLGSPDMAALYHQAVQDKLLVLSQEIEAAPKESEKRRGKQKQHDMLLRIYGEFGPLLRPASKRQTANRREILQEAHLHQITELQTRYKNNWLGTSPTRQMGFSPG